MAFDVDDAMRIARWFIVTRPKLKKSAMALGGVDEVVNESVLMLLKNGNGLKKYKLSSCVAKNVMWAIASMTKAKIRQDRALDSPAIAKHATVDSEAEECAISRETSQGVNCAIKQTLSCRERLIVKARMHGYTFDEIAADHRITRERVRQIEAKAWRKLAPKLEYLFDGQEGDTDSQR